LSIKHCVIVMTSALFNYAEDISWDEVLLALEDILMKLKEV
jgi:hypothetical protein